jgi:hypothetical protein
MPPSGRIRARGAGGHGTEMPVPQWQLCCENLPGDGRLRVMFFGPVRDVSVCATIAAQVVIERLQHQERRGGQPWRLWK